jgi:hypothetical protein
MSAPGTNTEKQARRHRPALVGIIAAVAFAGIALVVFLVLALGQSDPPVPERADPATAVPRDAAPYQAAPATGRVPMNNDASE